MRAAVSADLGTLTDIYNHYVLTSHCTFDLDPLSAEDGKAWFSHYGTTGRYRLLVAEETGATCGYACSSRVQPRKAYETSVATSIYLAPDATGRGTGKVLYDALFQALAGEDVHRAYAGIALPNEASIRLHERFGFRQVALFSEQGRKFGRYWDVAWFEKEL